MKKLLALAFTLMLPINAAYAEEKLTVLLDWFVNPDHAPLIVAKEHGIFAKHGLDVELIAPADPNDPPKLVAAGKAPLAVSYQPQLHVQVGEGLPLKRIATLVATPLNSLVVLKDGPIQKITDLKGKRVGYSVGGFENVILSSMLAANGLSADDVEMINVNWSLSPSLLAKKVDAVIGAYRNFELNQMDIEGHPGRAFFPEEEGVPSYDELVIVAHSDNLDDPRFKPFLAAIEEGVQYLINHPDESWKLFIRNHKELDDELNRRAWADTLPRFALRPAALDSNRYERFANFLKEAGVVKEALPVSDYAIELR
ncbi:ABC transporter substrate-binding protein [Sneathiella chinensis]|uniref:ABC transporter ATP-binding protein n=1 Tax=Sneathiella chinensis TaxID=349750 RepID=A0ABQ5U4S3_9PROT|nr:ABC transporter substrate-binding protein [Sneathiella chinensis]GLQ07102.1 ABC transporter ATP-binding protein [Sneathiella chinensis]